MVVSVANPISHDPQDFYFATCKKSDCTSSSLPYQHCEPQQSAQGKMSWQDTTALCLCCNSLALFFIWFCCAAAMSQIPSPQALPRRPGRTDRNPGTRPPQSEATFCPSLLKNSFRWIFSGVIGILRESLGSHWYRGAQPSNARKAFLSCCALCHHFQERGSKNKGESCASCQQSVLIKQRSFMLCGICLFIFVFFAKGFI